MVIIDTSAWVDFFRRDGDLPTKLAVKGLLYAFEGALCGPVEMEFLGGARKNEVPKIKAWFDIIPYLENNQKLWRLVSQNYAKLRAEGHTIPWNDIMIATIAVEKEAAVFAHDKHFPIMKRFTYTSLLSALAKLMTYVITSFGIVYATKYFGYYGIFIILIPIGSLYYAAVRYFERLEVTE